MACDFDLKEKQDDAEDDERKSGEIDGKRIHGIERQDDRNDPHDAGEYGPRVVNLEEKPVEAQKEEDVGDVRVVEDIQEPELPAHSLLRHRGAGSPENPFSPFDSHVPAVDGVEKLGD